MSAPRHSRRQLLALAGAGGVAWTVPQIASMSAAAAQGSCTTTTLNWVGRFGVNGVPPKGTPIAIGGSTTMTITATNTHVATNNGKVVPTSPGPGAPQGNQSSYYCLGIGPDPVVNNSYPVGATTTNTFAFNMPVQDLSYTLLDLDTSAPGPGYRDVLRISWAPATTTVSYSPGSGMSNTAPNEFTGTANAIATSTVGNLGVVFNGPVSSFTLTYIAGGNIPAPGTRTTQIMGLSNMTLCTP